MRIRRNGVPSAAMRSAFLSVTAYPLMRVDCSHSMPYSLSMSKPRIPTQRNISALLAKAGFTKSVSTPSRIKGCRNHSDGYVVMGHREGVVWVLHEVVSTRPLTEDRKRIETMLAKYKTAVEAAGFAVTRGSDRLIVTARPEEG
jgi:hypothetical protein